MRLRNAIGWLVVVTWVAGSPATAQDKPGNLRVDYVSPALLADKTVTPLPHPPLPDDWPVPLIPPRRRLTSAQKWERFEAEFGIHDPEASPFKAKLRLVKYHVDRAVFWADDLAKTVERALVFDFRLVPPHGAGGHDSVRQPPSHPLLAAWHDARLQAKIKLEAADIPRLSLRLDVPIGD